MATTPLLVVFVVVALFVGVQATCPWSDPSAVKWSSASTWSPSAVPVSGTNVVIPAGKKVIYDVTAQGITYAGITLSAGSELILDGTQNVWLETAYINVVSASTFRIGASDCHYTTKATITLFGPKDTTTMVVPFLGVKGIFVNGTLEWYASPPQPTWTTITATAPVNATTITVKDALTNWKVGDTIVLASTDYYQDLTERFTIAAISGSTITLDHKVKYLHWGANDEFAEVGDYTRNVVIQGDATSDALGFGGHVIVHAQGIAHVYGVEFTRMGQMGVLARYPMHWHFMGDQIGKGQFVSESSFHDNYQRCITVHGTSGVALTNNVGYNVTGHCYFLEEGSESYNTYTHNLGMVVNPGPMIFSDQQPSIFWITNPNNTFVNNVAVGGTFGFWFSLPLHPIGLSATLADYTWVYPRYVPLGRFDNNLAHSASDSGIFLDNGPDATGDTSDEVAYSPLVPPYTSSTQSYNTPSVRATFSGNNAYKNRQHGIWARGSGFTFTNSLLQDNGVGINFPAMSNVFANSTVVGETTNIGTPGHTQYFDDKGRSRPILWWADFPIHGFEGYDNTGGQHCRNVSFVNFTSNSVRRAGAVGAITNGIFVLPGNDLFAQIKLINSNAFAMPDRAWGTVYTDYDGPTHIVFLDTDGSLTGAYGNAIASNNTLVQDGGCVPVPAWNNYWNCSRNVDGYSYLEVINQNTANTDFGTTLTQTYRATFIPFGKTTQDRVTGGDPRDSIRTEYATNLISRHGYLLQFQHPTPPQLQVVLRFASTGEWVVVALQYPNTTFTITRGYANTPLTPATSLSGLTKSTYYYDAINEYLYVMYYEEDGGLNAPAGFPQYGYGASYININAGCGNKCAVGTHAVPATYPDTDDKYQVTLQGCSSGSSSGYQGVGYFRYNRNTHVVNYIIYHNMPTATIASIYSQGVLYQTLPVGQSPIRGAFTLSWNKWNNLWNGNFTLSVLSNAYSGVKGEISGRLGCVGSCSVPPSISAADPCAFIVGQEYLYDDVLNTTGGWADWSYASTRNYSYPTDKKCGQLALNTLFNTWGAVALHMGQGDCNPGACTASWQRPYLSMAAFSFFQFSVRSPAGPLPTPIVVTVQSSTSVNLGSVVVGTQYIDNYVVEETWTRVKIPLAALGVKPTDLVGIFTIQLQATLNNFQVIFDNIRLVPTYSDPITAKPVGSVYNYVVQC